MMISFGIVSYGKPKILKNLLDSFKNIEIDVPFEICIFQNNPSENGSECIKLIEEFRTKFNNVHIINFTSKNIGFWACWNCLENIMTGEYKAMLQEDMIFFNNKSPEKVSDILQYMKDNNYVYMALGGTPNKETLKNYTDWAHIEHKSFRQTYGDFDCYPKYFSSLMEQATLPEPRYSTKLSKSACPPIYAIYPKQIAACQWQGDSIYQTLIHEFNKLNIPDEEKKKVWDNPDIDILKQYNIKIWK